MSPLLVFCPHVRASRYRRQRLLMEQVSSIKLNGKPVVSCERGDGRAHAKSRSGRNGGRFKTTEHLPFLKPDWYCMLYYYCGLFMHCFYKWYLMIFHKMQQSQVSLSIDEATLLVST